MKWFISMFAATTAALFPGCTPQREATAPAPTGTQATEIVHVDPAGAAKLVDGGELEVLDVRTPGEFKSGHIKGAVNIDYHGSDFRQRLARLDRGKTYLVHCAVGGRSTSALAAFNELGFKQVVHLDGGIKAWEKDGEPMVK